MGRTRSLLLELLVLAGAAGAVGAVIYWRRRRSAGEGAEAGKGEPPSVWNVGPGALIELEGTMMDVLRALDCTDGGVVWRELLLADRDRSLKVWLAIEDDDGLVLTRSFPIEAPSDLASGFPRVLDVDGRSFELEEKGRARARVSALDVPDQEATFTYAVWLGPGSSRVSVEQWGGDVDWFRGEPISEGLVDVYGGA